jgi:hypothetical protein
VKWCESSKARLQEVKAAAIARMTTVEQVFLAIDEIVETMDTKRKSLKNLIAERKEKRKKEIVDAGARSLEAHVQALEARLLEALPEGASIKGTLMPEIEYDFWGVIHGKSSFANMASAVSDHLATCKVVANRAFELRQGNLHVLQDKAKDHKHLFADWRDLIAKDAEFVELTIAQRIQADKERIDAEARKKRENEAAAAAAREAQERQQQNAAPVAEQVAAAAPVVAAAPTTAPGVVPIRRGGFSAPAPAPRTLTLTVISQRLGFTLPALFISEKLGVEGERVHTATKFSEPEYDQILCALQDYVGSLRNRANAA